MRSVAKNFIINFVFCMNIGTPVCLAQTASGMGDITVLSNDIGHFEHGDKIIHIFANSRNVTQNSDNPSRWQFVIEPLLSTVIDESKQKASRKEAAEGRPPLSDGDLILFYEADLEPIYKSKGGRLVRFSRRRIIVPVRMITHGSRLKVLELLDGTLGVKKCEFGEQNIDVLPVTMVHVDMPDLDAAGVVSQGTITLVSKDQFFIASPSTFFLRFNVVEGGPGQIDKEVKAFVSRLPFLQIDATMTFAVKSTAVNIISVDWSKLRDTDLGKQLTGKAQAGTDGNAYVSRDDLRKLSYSASTQLSSLAIIEDRASFDSNLFSTLINESTVVSKTEDWFTNESAKQTYDADDLKPSNIKSWINKVFTKETGKDEWHFNADTSAGGSFLDIIKAEGKGNFSTSQLKEFLKAHSIDTEIQGDIIVPKSIDLLQINVSKFAARTKSFVEYRNIEKGGQKPDLKTTIYGKPVADPEPTTGFAACPPATGRDKQAAAQDGE